MQCLTIRNYICNVVTIWKLDVLHQIRVQYIFRMAIRPKYLTNGWQKGLMSIDFEMNGLCLWGKCVKPLHQMETFLSIITQSSYNFTRATIALMIFKYGDLIVRAWFQKRSNSDHIRSVSFVGRSHSTDADPNRLITSGKYDTKPFIANWLIMWIINWEVISSHRIFSGLERRWSEYNNWINMISIRSSKTSSCEMVHRVGTESDHQLWMPWLIITKM